MTFCSSKSIVNNLYSHGSTTCRAQNPAYKIMQHAWRHEDQKKMPQSLFRCVQSTSHPSTAKFLIQVEGRNRNGNRNMTSVVVEKRQPLSCQSNQRTSSGAGKLLTRVHTTSDKGQLLMACSSTNILA